MFVQWREERACLALEIIRNHAYARSRFLRGAREVQDHLVAARALAYMGLEPGTPVTEIPLERVPRVAIYSPPS